MPIRTSLPGPPSSPDGKPVEAMAPEDLASAARHIVLPLLKGDLSIGSLLSLSEEDLLRLVELGRSHYTMQRFEDARRVFDGLTALEPSIALFHQLAGMALEATGALDDAWLSTCRSVKCRPSRGISENWLRFFPCSAHRCRTSRRS